MNYIKKYSLKEIKNNIKFSKFGDFESQVSICPECKQIRALTFIGHEIESCGWVYYFQCTKCDSKFEFIPKKYHGIISDPYMVKIEKFNELENTDSLMDSSKPAGCVIDGYPNEYNHKTRIDRINFPIENLLNKRKL